MYVWVYTFDGVGSTSLHAEVRDAANNALSTPFGGFLVVLPPVGSAARPRLAPRQTRARGVIHSAEHMLWDTHLCLGALRADAPTAMNPVAAAILAFDDALRHMVSDALRWVSEKLAVDP